MLFDKYLKEGFDTYVKSFIHILVNTVFQVMQQGLSTHVYFYFLVRNTDSSEKIFLFLLCDCLALAGPFPM